MQTNQIKHYYSQRELAERAAAEAAVSPEAKQVHERLADLFAELVQQPDAAETAGSEPEAPPHFVVLTRN